MAEKKIPKVLKIPKILITRPRQDIQPLAREIQEMGCAVFSRPLFNIKLLKPKDDLQDWAEEAGALIFSSAHGVRAFARTPHGRAALQEKIAFTVGEASADEARRLGARKIFFPKEGESAALVALILSKRHALPPKQPLLHLAGRHRAGRIGKALSEEGVPFRRAVLYEARAVRSLGRELLNLLRQRRIWGALFFSRRASALFAERLRDHQDCEKTLRHLRAFCLSKSVAEPFAESGIAWREVHIASAPCRAAMREKLRSVLKKEGALKGGAP